MSSKRKLRVAIIAPPWIALPVRGYGGIELVLEGLVSALKSRNDIEVELFANGERTIPGVKTHSLFKEEQFKNIYKPFFESYAIVRAHVEFAYNTILEDGTFDIIHDHNGMNLGRGRITISTSGILPKIKKFIDDNILVGVFKTN